MDALRWELKPKLRSPALVCAFKGWNDAGEAASAAIEFVASQWSARRFAAIDPEEFFDFQMTRPKVRLTEGRTRRIEWPEVLLSGANLEEGERDIALLAGAEPNLRWRTFCDTVVRAAKELGVDLVITLGALLADVPHTRPVPITGIAGDPGLVERLGFSETRYEGPTGIVGCLHNACAGAGLPSASLWAAVPYYVSTVPSPKATLALVRRLEGLLEVVIDATELEQATADYERRLEEAVESEPEVRALVERLETQMDEQEISFSDLPTGDSLAKEIERFLRERAERDEG